MNKQPIEKRVDHVGVTLDVHSIFYTIQGEGPFAGTPAVFIRLAGCNLQCPGCDTQYTEGRKIMGIHETIDEINKVSNVRIDCPKPLIVITGGEPFRQNLGMFIELLTIRDFWIQIETNGTLPPSKDRNNNNLQYNLDISERRGVYIVCSPKTPKINPLIKHFACCFKYVLNHNDYDLLDGLPNHVLGHKTGGKVARPREGALVYLQPMDHMEEMRELPNPDPWFPFNIELERRNKMSLEVVKDLCMKYGYIFQLQIHKIIGVA